ncbi:MAG: cytochrome c oxidase subunit II [Deltaproteobacteria bacterium]|nr:cytochrome c oxidase subunit II [Deltaproteobacteria bacterium]
MLRWLPEDVSPYGAGIDALFYLIYYITAAAFLLVTAVMIALLIKYRYQTGRRAVYTHGNTTLEIVWTVIPALVFIGLGIASKAQWDELKVNIPESDTVIHVTGKQFNWEVLYPGPDGQFHTADDKQVDNEIRVPVGKPIRMVLKSKDVIHSFFLPQLRFKQDAVPGREILTWFQANKPGKYEIPCAELCGFGHSGMRGWLYVLSAEEYAQWVAQQWPQGGTQIGPQTAAAGAAVATTDATP